LILAQRYATRHESGAVLHCIPSEKAQIHIQQHNKRCILYIQQWSHVQMAATSTRGHQNNRQLPYREEGPDGVRNWANVLFTWRCLDAPEECPISEWCKFGISGTIVPHH
jgi:hypothetical protein